MPIISIHSVIYQSQLKSLQTKDFLHNVLVVGKRVFMKCLKHMSQAHVMGFSFER